MAACTCAFWHDCCQHQELGKVKVKIRDKTVCSVKLMGNSPDMPQLLSWSIHLLPWHKVSHAWAVYQKLENRHHLNNSSLQIIFLLIPHSHEKPPARREPVPFPCQTIPHRLWCCHHTPVSSFVCFEKSKKVRDREDSTGIQGAAAELPDSALGLWHMCPWYGLGSCCPGDSCRDLVEAITAPFSPVIEVSITWKWGANSSNTCRCHWVMVILSTRQAGDLGPGNGSQFRHKSWYHELFFFYCVNLWELPHNTESNEKVHQ